MNNKLLYILIGLIIGVVGVYVINSNFINNKASTTQSMQASDTIDAHFIEQMIPHHEDAITMAKLALEKAQRPEVKQLAGSIISSQEAEIIQMKKWYKDWFGRDLPTGDQVMQSHGMGSNSGMHMGIRGDQSDMTNLTNAGDFDIAFLEQMIPHHQMAVMMASMLKQGTKRPEMTKLAEDIINAQSEEIDQMREWLKEPVN